MMNLTHAIDLHDHIDLAARESLDDSILRDDDLDDDNLQFTIDAAFARAESFAYIHPDYNFPPDILHELICLRITHLAHNPPTD